MRRQPGLRFNEGLLFRLVGDDRPESLPALAVKLHHLQLLVDAIVVRRGCDGDSRQQQIELHIAEMGGLLQHVLAGKVVTALFQNVNQKLCCDVAVDVENTCHHPDSTSP